MKIDLRDVITFGGIGLAGYGCYNINPALAPVIVGLMLFALGLAGR